MANFADDGVTLYQRLIKFVDREFMIWCFVTAAAGIILNVEPPLLPSAASENERIWAGLIFYGQRVLAFAVWAFVSAWWCSRRMKLKEIEAAQPKVTTT